jgi:hypothetical protein
VNRMLVVLFGEKGVLQAEIDSNADKNEEQNEKAAGQSHVTRAVAAAT